MTAASSGLSSALAKLNKVMLSVKPKLPNRQGIWNKDCINHTQKA